jgi:hypothetical protein
VANQPVWLQQRAYQQALQLVQPTAALSAAPQLPPDRLALLVRALLRVLDEAMHMAMRQPHSGALPAATAVQMLTEVLLQPATAKSVPWAISASCDQMGRIVATPGCPVPVLHAASHALRQLQMR